MARRAACTVCLLLVLLGGCIPPPADEPADGPLKVFVGIPPLAYLAERIGGEHVAVQVLLPTGQDPHTFQLTPKQVVVLSRAQLFFKIGLPFENRLAEKLAHDPRLPQVVDVTDGIKKRRMDADCRGHGADDHAEENEHGEEWDPHVWLSPPLLKTQAASIAAALERADPAHEKDYQTNLAHLCEDLDATSAKIAEALAPLRGQAFFVFHPALGYFADAYGLKQEAVEAGGKSPTPRQLGALIEKAKAQHVKIIFVQPQFDQHRAQTVAKAIGGSVVRIDPLAKDVLRNLADIAAQIKQGLLIE